MGSRITGIGLWRPSLVVFALLASFSISGLAGQAAENDRFRYGLEKNNQIFLSKKEAKKGGSFTLAISGGKEAQLSIDLVDIYADPSGSKRVLPLGSSDFSPKSLVKFKKTGTTYSPSGEFQFFEIPFRFKKKADLSRPILGGLKISLITKDSSSNDLRVESSVVGTFSYYPKGAGLGFSPSIRLSEEKLIRPNSDFPPFGFLPDFPFLFNGGGLEVSYKTENTGNIFLETNTEVVVKGPLFFGWGTDAVPFESSDSKAFLVPNQVFVDQVPIEIVRPNERGLDPLGFGFYEVQINVIGSLGSDLLAGDSSSRIILIFPWKFVLTALILLILFRRTIVSTARKSLLLFQTLREFTKNKRDDVVGSLDEKSSTGTVQKAYDSTPRTLPKLDGHQASTSALLPVHSSRPSQSVPADLFPLYPESFQSKKPKPVNNLEKRELPSYPDSLIADGGSNAVQP